MSDNKIVNFSKAKKATQRKTRIMQGIVYGIADSFMSRNTDIDGYWVPGIYYKLAQDASQSTLILDLLKSESTPQYEHSYIVAYRLNRTLTKQLNGNALKDSLVTSATITLHFNVDKDEDHINSYRLCGDPFTFIFELTDNLEHIFRVVRKGWCAPYTDPILQRSSRRLTPDDPLSTAKHALLLIAKMSGSESPYTQKEIQDLAYTTLLTMETEYQVTRNNARQLLYRDVTGLPYNPNLHAIVESSVEHLATDCDVAKWPRSKLANSIRTLSLVVPRLPRKN